MYRQITCTFGLNHYDNQISEPTPIAKKQSVFFVRGDYYKCNSRCCSEKDSSDDTDKQESNEESSHCGGVPHHGSVVAGNSGNICPAGERQYRLQ